MRGGAFSPGQTGRPGQLNLGDRQCQKQLDFPGQQGNSCHAARLSGGKRQRWRPQGELEAPVAPEDRGPVKTGRSCRSGGSGSLTSDLASRSMTPRNPLLPRPSITAPDTSHHSRAGPCWPISPGASLALSLPPVPAHPLDARGGGHRSWGDSSPACFLVWAPSLPPTQGQGSGQPFVLP